ncbi:DUF1768-domain-containing protein [Suillus bovinus]|uniref:DUF1768-domain-containing protein n=1 Tax=Suillus bovinus TaxID=48563 RepID=UPI001B861EFD|nr:DUF1768-domain-containing protein [Suillus bovinus]KAG2149039.1 DUF1768-domain-containing protein [Suillus bovinus]
MLDNRMIIMKITSIFRIGLNSPPDTPQARQARPATQYHSAPSNLKLSSPDVQNDGESEAYYPPLTAPPEPVGSSVAPFQRRECILFYNKHEPYYEFTNFSPHDVVYAGKRYPTSEHLFQSFKFLDSQPAIAEHIRKCGDRPSTVFDEAHRHQKWVRSDWRQVNVEKMEVTLRLKFTQHTDLKALLLGTGDAELVENSPRDFFWGIGADGSGRNELGKALVRVRDELRHDDKPNRVPPVKRDTSRFSLQDLTSLVVAAASANPPIQASQRRSFVSAGMGIRPPSTVLPQPPFQAPQRLSIVPTGMAVSPQSASYDAGLCEFCQQKPKYQHHPYCGRTCATQAATTCNHCRSKPKYGKHPYCSKTCAVQAGKAT